MRRAILFAALAALALGGAAGVQAQAQAQAEKRVALVIGNAAYKDAPLKNPVNDARAMAARLRLFGFEVIVREDATRAQMAEAVLNFAGKLKQGGEALFFYAGHGIQARGRNYLIPVDASIQNESAVQFAALDVGAVLAEMEQSGSRVSLVILDACRNNPFERRLRGAARGLAAIDAARGSFIAYATAPGSVAADGDGANGLYTAELLKALAEPGLKVEEVFKRVRVEVAQQTRNQQVPWESTSLTGDFILNLGIITSAPFPPVISAMTMPNQSDREALFWNSIKDSRRAEDYADYLAQYPVGDFAGIARRRLEEMNKMQTATAPVYTPQLPRPAAAAAVAARPAPSPQSADGTRARLPYDGTWLGVFTRHTSDAQTASACRSARSEFVVADGRITDAFVKLDDGREFTQKDARGLRLEFEGLFGADGRIDIKMRAFDNINTNFMNLIYKGRLQQDTGEGDWRDDFGKCAGVFKLERKR